MEPSKEQALTATAPAPSEQVRWWRRRKNRHWVNFGIYVAAFTVAFGMVTANWAGGFGICLLLTTLAVGPALAVALLAAGTAATWSPFQWARGT